MTDPVYLDGFTQSLRAAIAAVCPVASVSIGDPAQASTWSFAAEPSATMSQIQAGQGAVAVFSYVAPSPTVTGRQIKDRITAAGCSASLVALLAKAGQAGGPKPDDYIYWLGIALDTNVPIDNPKVGRILVGSGCVNADGSSAVPAFMAAAQGLPA